ncbi:MAG: tetratricopeptide repeat protein [Aphanizomenon sp.]
MSEQPQINQSIFDNVNIGGSLKTGDISQNIYFQPKQLEGNPFKLPQRREGGLFGREEELEKLHELLQSGKNVCVVSGMGGIGKTGLVREYANLPECTSLFTGGVYYIDVRDRENMAGEIIALTKWRFKADLPANLSTQQMVTACWQQWKYQTENVLLIFDDISSLNKDIKSYLPPKDLVSLRVLMTSRETPDKRIAEKLELQVLSEAAAVDLLASIIGQERIDAEPKEAKLLCYELGYLPLALELVGYYLDDEDYQDLSLLAMGDKLREKVKHPSLSPEQVPGGIQAKRGLQAAFDLSWEELKPEAQYLACVLAAFAPSPIRWDFVTRIYQQLQGELFNHDNLKDRWLKSLRKLHLVITVDKDIYNLHLLIHDYFYEQLKQHLNFSQIKQAFCDVFVVVASNIDQSTNLETFNLIEPHLKKMIAWCENKEDIEFALSLNNLARLYYFQGRYNDAEPLFLQSLDILKLQLGNDHPDVAQSLNNLAQLYYSQGRYNDAELLYLQSLDILKRQLGYDHPDVAQSLNNLAQLYFSQENYLEAENLAQQALVIYQQKLGSEHPDTQNAAVGVKLLYIMKLLQCNKNTLFSILEALAQQASLPDLNTETALTLLEQIENNPDLLSSIREYLQRQTEASDDDT